MRDARMVTRHKNKGDKGSCNSFRGISLLSAAGKIFARVLVKRLKRLPDRVLSETQSGLVVQQQNLIFTLRQLQKNAGNKENSCILPLLI